MKTKLVILMCIIISLFIIPQAVSAATEGNYTYTVTYGGVEITDFPTSVSGDIIIPGTLGGYPVISIGDNAFESCWELTGITIPDGVTTIGNYAFKSCQSLTKIIIPGSVADIGDHAFYNCPLTDDIIIPNGVEYIGNYAFYSCDMTAITIPGTVKSIGTSAFSYCSNLKEVFINYGVTEIKDYTFESCHNLAKVSIPESVTYIGKAFKGSYKIEEITLPFIGSERGKTRTIDSVFGAIFDYRTTGTGKAWYYKDDSFAYYSVPSSLRKVTITDEIIVPYGAFYGCQNMTDIVIDCDVSAVMQEAFSNIDSMVNVTIKSNNVRFPKTSIFTGSDFATLLSYKGSTSEAYANEYDIYFVPVTEDENEPYTINKISLKKSGTNEDLSVIPDANFIAELDVKNNAYNDKATFVIATFDIDDNLINLFYMYSNLTIGSKTTFGTTIKNADGKICKLKAFVWKKLGDLVPLAKSVEISK